MKTYLIIGCGYFGGRAAEELFKKYPGSKITAVDKSPEAVKKLPSLPIVTIVQEGISYLNRLLSEGGTVDYVIPSVPFHFAFEFILRRLKAYGAKRAPLPPLPELPNPEKGRRGDLYTSLADFLCPEDCPGPARYCTVTSKRREKPLYQILGELEGPFVSKVLISEQLLPGVGGFRLSALLALLDEIKKSKNSALPFLISTASRCHGVTSALSFQCGGI